MKKSNVRFLYLGLLLAILLSSNMASGELKTGCATSEAVGCVSTPNSDLIEATMDWTTKTADVDVDDYTMTTSDLGSKLHMPVPDAYIYAGTSGESAVDVGTSYITLEESTILGDYASESKSWSEYAFLETTFGSVTESPANMTQTAPALSAGSSDAYISTTSTYSSTSGVGGNEYSYFQADVWNDIDDDGVDDSATVTGEEYVPITQNVYIFVVMKIVSSDTDIITYGQLFLQFYTGSSDYVISFTVEGGAEASSTDLFSTTYTDSATNQGSFDVNIAAREAEGEYVTFLVDLAALIAADTDDSPNISGINGYSLGSQVSTGYGDGTDDSTTVTLHNLAIFDQPPALTDRTLGTGNTITYVGETAATATSTGDATNYAKHDILLPYVVAASANDWDSRIYFENDISDEELLLSRFHMLSMNGKMRVPPNRDFSDAGGSDVIGGITMNTETGNDKQRRDVNLFWDFDYKRESDNGDFITAGYAPTLSAHNLVQVLDNDDQYAPSINELEKALISANLATASKLDTFETAWDSWSASTTSISIDLWSTDPSDGDSVEIKYSYWTHESGIDLDEENGQGNWEIAGLFARADAKDKWYDGLAVIDGVGVFFATLGIYLFGRKKK